MDESVSTIFQFLFLFQSSVQYSQCTWDKDTDEMHWLPGEIDECSRK